MIVYMVLGKQTEANDGFCVMLDKNSYYPVLLELTNNDDTHTVIQAWLTAAEALELAAALEKAAKGHSDE